MEKEKYLKAIPIYNDIDDLERKLKNLELLKGNTTTLLSVVFDMNVAFQLRGLDEKFTQSLVDLIKNHLKVQRNELVKEFIAL